MSKAGAFKIPENGFSGLRENFKADFLSGFLVFLIALPLCLGIAKASGFPSISGIITAIIGGILVTLLHGSYVTIKGPAAGLIIIVAGSVQALGYEKALAAIVVSGIIQIIFGILRSGRFGDFFPSSAVHGMLVAIGIIVAVKQIPNAFGVIPEAKTTVQAILEIPRIITHVDPIIGIIGILSLIILFGMPVIADKIAWVKKVPAAMIVLLVTIPLGQYYHLDSRFLVSLPTDLVTNFKSAFTFPDFSEVFSLTSIYWIAMYAMVGSLESLLSTKAIDILDPYKRKANLDKDLLAVGVGNTLCGFLGALPMISEIVRSSANINNGAVSKWSNFFHGLFLLVSILFLANFINMIPLAALGAMLVFTGYRLASPKVFSETYRVGKEQLMIFVTTLVVILATDLIVVGIFSGILVKFLFHIYSGASISSLFKSNVSLVKDSDNTYTLTIKEAAVFSNFLGLKKVLDSIPLGNKIVLDFGSAKLIDHTVMEHLHHYGEDYERAGGKMHVKGMEKLRPLSAHPLSYRVAIQEKYSEINVDPRTKQLQELGKKIRFSFNAASNVKSNFGKFRSSPIRIKYEGNVLSGTIGNNIYTVSDISLAQGGNMKAQIYQATVLSISNLHLGIPIFNMEKERVLDKVFENTFLNDIDFENHPVFSDKYKLTGLNEGEIRFFFTKNVLEYFEKNPVYSIESLGAELIIYKSLDIASVAEIEKMLAFAKGLVDVINSKKIGEEVHPN